MGKFLWVYGPDFLPEILHSENVAETEEVNISFMKLLSRGSQGSLLKIMSKKVKANHEL